MKHKKRFFLMLIPIVPALALMTVPGFFFTELLLLGISLLIGIFCLLSLSPARWAKICRNVLILVLIAGFFLAAATELFLISGSRADAGEESYVIVLGAGVNGTRPSLMLQDRIDAAYRYLTAHPDSICIVSGGQGSGEDISEAECMFRELSAMGIDPERIWMEDQSASTQENIAFSMELIKNRSGTLPERAGLVSNEFHLCRARLTARRQGLTVSGIPAHTSWVSLKINYYLREIPALWLYILKGGI